MSPYSCAGCIRQPIGGNPVSKTCMMCMRMQYKHDASSQKKDYYQSAERPKNQNRQLHPITGPNTQSVKFVPNGDVKLNIEAFPAPVILTEKDVYNWMTKCANRESLMRLSRYAKQRVDQIDTSGIRTVKSP